MARDGTIQIAILGDASNFQRALRSAGIGTTRFGGIVRSVARGAAIGLAGVAAGMALVSKEAVEAASDQGESLNKARVIFEKSAKSVVRWSKTTADAFGISRAAALETAGGFGAMLESAGLAEAEAAKMSKAIVELGSDMASFNNQDPSEMLDKLRSGLAGEAEPLRRFGVFLSEAAVQQQAYKDGIAEVGDELTDAQKVQARYNLIFEKTLKQQGDFARTVGESLPNQLRTIKAQWADLAASLGKQLIPMLRDVLPDLIGPLKQSFKALVPAIVAIAKEFANFLQKIAPQLPGLTKHFVRLVEAIRPLVPVVVDATERFVNMVNQAVTTARTVKRVIVDAWKSIRQAIDDALGPLDEIIAGMFRFVDAANLVKNSFALGSGGAILRAPVPPKPPKPAPRFEFDELGRPHRARNTGGGTQGPPSGFTINFNVDGKRIKKQDVRRSVLLGD